MSKRGRVAQPIIFTDLDGTLLELETYSFRASRDAVRKVHAAGVPLVFCSSKTRAEQATYRAALGVDAPFIVENGSAIFIPEGYFGFDYPFERVAEGYRVVELGRPVADIRRILAETRSALPVGCYGYADLSLAEVCRLTGLDEEAARRAARREFSETLLSCNVAPTDPIFLQFCDALARRGLVCMPGSRFHTISGAGSDKGRAALLLADLYRRKFGAVLTYGLGDGPNDAPLLAVVDRPFLVQRSDGRWADLDGPPVTRVEGIGPDGWRKAVLELIEF